MNTSASTNQTHAATRITARTTPVGFRRRTMAGILLATAITATAVGLAATGHADTGAGTPDTDTTTSAPAPFALSFPWVDGFVDGAGHPHPDLHCGFQLPGHFQCYWF